MYQAWQAPQGYNHGPLVTIIWLFGSIFLTRKTIDSFIWHGYFEWQRVVSLMSFLFIGFVSEVAQKFGIETVQYLALVIFLIVSVYYVYQPQDKAKYILLSVVLISGIPIWDIAILFLQPLVILVTDSVLTALRVPVLIMGSTVTLPSGTFEIAEGCAGLRFLLAALAFSAMYALLYIDKNVNRLVFILTACLLAIVSNLVRVVSIIWAGFVTEMQSALVDDHYAYGWLIFCIALAPSLWLGSRIARTEARRRLVVG